MNSITNRISPLADSNITDAGNLVIIKKVSKGSSLKVIKFQDERRKSSKESSSSVVNEIFYGLLL